MSHRRHCCCEKERCCDPCCDPYNGGFGGLDGIFGGYGGGGSIIWILVLIFLFCGRGLRGDCC